MPRRTTSVAVAGATLAAVAVRAYRRDIAAASARLAEPDVPVHRLSLPWGTVEYARYGEGPPVLVLHGTGGGWDQGVDWARRRLAGEHDVISVSRFGYLGSTLPPDASTAAQADAFAELLDSLGIDRVDVVGMSGGAITAVRFAGQHPDRVRSLVLESPVLPTERPAPLPPAPVVRLLAHAQPLVWLIVRSPLLVGVQAGVPKRELDAAGRAELAEIVGTALPLTPRAAGMVFDGVVAGPEMTGGHIRVDRISAPPLVINAADAVLAPRSDAEAFVRKLADGRLLDVETGGHVLIGNVEYLRGVLADFLRSPARAGERQD